MSDARSNGAALEAVAKEVRRCTACPLHEGRTQAVPGEGPVNARIVLVGEAPGRNEDETGRPFCGAAGKNLDLGLEAAGLQREDVFVTSINKCRPPKNRDPTAAEKAACRPFLVRQLHIIQPDVIVALGRHGLSALLDPVPAAFSKAAGTMCGTYEGVPVWASLHPAAIIYRQAWREAYMEHWTRFGAWVRDGAPDGTF